MSEIKPCPFCGGEAERLDIEDGENAGGSCVCCKQCFASGHVEFGRKENFVSRWNARPIEDELAASRDRASDACASVQRERDALREMLVHATDALRNLERANEEVCAARTVRTYHSYVSDGAEPLLLGLDNARERARAFLSRYEGEVK